MKTGKLGNKGLYAGVGAGLVLFALTGLLPGTFIGGVVGLNIAGSIFGLPLTASLLPRLVVAAGMVLGVLLSGVAFVTAGAIVGYGAGHVADMVHQSRTNVISHAHAVKIN